MPFKKPETKTELAGYYVGRTIGYFAQGYCLNLVAPSMPAKIGVIASKPIIIKTVRCVKAAATKYKRSDVTNLFNESMDAVLNAF